jgi:hypothetical protein
MSDEIVFEAMMSGVTMSGAMPSEGTRLRGSGMTPDPTASALNMASEKDMISIGGKMNHDELDHILSQRDEIQPSSGFAVAVMEAVREEAAAPSPIPFPWTRALPVLLVAVVALIAVAVAGIAVVVQTSRQTVAPELATSWWSALAPYMRGAVGTDLAWTAAALLAAFVSVKLSMRLASGRA